MKELLAMSLEELSRAIVDDVSEAERKQVFLPEHDDVGGSCDE